MTVTVGCGVIQSPPASGDDDGSGSGSGSGSGAAPQKGVFYGSVLDERNDVIDFSTHVPIHTHGGAPIDLGGDCPAVYKYAYLEGVQPPQFGGETTPNPLAWHIVSDVAALDPIGSAYRVRDDAGGVLLDWTAMNPGSDGAFTIDLRRDRVPAIGTQASRMYVDARFRDTAGIETVKTACWDNHPLAAPLEIGAPSSGDLFAMSFASHSYISRLMNIGSPNTPMGPSVATFTITQDAAESTHLYLASSVPTGTGTKDVVDEFVVIQPYADNYVCGPGGCPTVKSPVATTGNSPIHGVWVIRLLDATGRVVCESAAADPFKATCMLPPRTADPVTYHAVLQLSGETSIAPVVQNLSSSTFSDNLIGNKWISGTADTLYTQGCSVTRIQAEPNGAIQYICIQSTDYIHVVAVNNAHIAFDAIQFTPKTAVGDDTTALTLPYIAPLVWPAQTWDSGNAGL